MDWDLFDIIGIDHYRDARVKDSYTERLAPLLRLGKPVVVTEFGEPGMTYSEEPRYDLDMSGMALVKTYTSGHGTTYPDMTWEPKQAFRAVAGYYAKDSASTTAGD